MDEKKWVSIEPTPQGLVQIEKMFRDTIEKSEKIIEECEFKVMLLETGDYIFEREEYEEDTLFLIEAIEAYASQERKRIVDMVDGLHAMGKER